MWIKFLLLYLLITIPLLGGKFYVSTDDPNVWIEVDDSEIGLED